MISCNVITPAVFLDQMVPSECGCRLDPVDFREHRDVVANDSVIVMTLASRFPPASWGFYAPTWVDIGTYIGTFGLFFTMFLLFMRFLPSSRLRKSKRSHRRLIRTIPSAELNMEGNH
jgi:molybdopterin-containing oxidoreductase family membrane subunit